MEAEETDLGEVLDIVTEAGHIMLQNGAEIYRVEETMRRIARYYGVPTSHFFILSNGIFTTSSSPRKTDRARNYANVEFIPMQEIQFDKVAAVSQLSYDICGGKCTPAEARERLEGIRKMPRKPDWERILCSGLGSAGFCAVFGGGYLDCAAAGAVGLLLYAFILLMNRTLISKILRGICNATVATLLSVFFWKIGFGQSLSNIIIGAVMPLVPGVAFVNGVRDLADSDYLAGITRLTDALLGFFCISIGVVAGFLAGGALFGEPIQLAGVSVSPQTYSLPCQCTMAFVATAGFACLFGVPRSSYLPCGIAGVLCWLSYLLLVRYAGWTSGMAVLAATTLTCFVARICAVMQKRPTTIYLICGLFPLVPGAGIFWSTYYLATQQMDLASSAGFQALKVAIAIVLGIILGEDLIRLELRIRRRRKAPKKHS